MKLCGAWVTIISTACAMSSGCNILLTSFFPRGEKSVATLPGQIALTRTPYARKSSAMHSVNPSRPHFEAQ